MKEKIFFGGLDMLRPKVNNPTKMPRTAIIPVITDPQTGYLNAAPYSGGVANLKPLHILFGPKSAITIQAFKNLEEFSVAVPSKRHINQMWAMALGVPRGINEMDLVGWNPLPSQIISTPGIEQCPINLECKKIFYEKLPDPWRASVVAEVVGVSVNRSLLEMQRSDVVRHIPMHESSISPKTGLYGPTVLTGELLPSSGRESVHAAPLPAEGGEKIFVSGQDLYKPKNDKVYINSVFPRPTVFIMTTDAKGKTNVLPLSAGKLQNSVPTLTMPIPRDSYTYDNIKRLGEFVAALPDRSLIKSFEKMEKNLPDGFDAAGLSLLRENMVMVKGIAECPVNIDYKVVIFKDVPGADYAILEGRRVGVSYDKELFERLTKDWMSRSAVKLLNEFYGNYLYAVLDEGSKRKWGFHDPKTLSVRGMPTWGSRYGTSWTNPKYFNYWLIELVQQGLLAPRDLDRLAHTLMLWNNGTGQEHLLEYYDDRIKKELHDRLTKVLKMMMWAHRDRAKWKEVHEFVSTFPEPEIEPLSGPLVKESWNGEKIDCMNLLLANLK